ncbi:hypothetical protein VNO77_32848 [Canavalia gladiata]|uniref:Transmembrane protein n=1 Tax=Canavalia gladiata TaxID=3824 RepID=A0AAN9PZW0_CANGL
MCVFSSSSEIHGQPLNTTLLLLLILLPYSSAFPSLSLPSRHPTPLQPTLSSSHSFHLQPPFSNTSITNLSTSLSTYFNLNNLKTLLISSLARKLYKLIRLSMRSKILSGNNDTLITLIIAFCSGYVISVLQFSMTVC